MSIFLPVAGISIRVWILLGAGGLVGFLSGLLGVGGGFLLTPILMLAGIPPTVAAASDSCQIVAASSSAVAAHFRLGNVDFKMGITLLAGGLTGAALGVQAIKILRALGNADSFIAITYIVVLGAVGGSMFVASLKNLRGGAMASKVHRAPARPGRLARLPLQVDFERSGVRHSLLVPFFLCVIVGILASIMGVGGAFMMVPMMVYLLGMPVHVAVGTSLFQTLFTCAGVTYMQSTTNHTVDLVLALALAAGSTIGAQVGARMTRFLRGDQLLIILAILALLVTVKMTVGIIATPANVLSPSGGHAMLYWPHAPEWCRAAWAVWAKG
ncbi:MAG: sulfite exporter TauE/SafE family protein [Candidatus Sulfopaludibacter sp.]|nr:sulfite exporter TauE/SafE family protein [Candidatus Sulfopaludibacter sp.]